MTTVERAVVNTGKVVFHAQEGQSRDLVIGSCSGGYLEKELKETKQTLGNVVLKLVKKVKYLEIALKRKSKKDIDDDPLVSLFRESMKEKSTYFVNHTKASGEAQEEEINPTILEAAKTLSKVASQSVSKAKSTDKGKRYRRRARSMAKNINTGLDAEGEINTSRVEINTGIEDVNTGSTKVDTATHKTKEQIRQEEAGLEEAIRLQAQMDEEVAKQIHLDKMVAKRVQEEQELSKQQLKRKVVKRSPRRSISNDDFAKRMVEMINKKKKFYVEQKAKAKRSKPMTQAQQRDMELRSDEEYKAFVPMETEARVKKHGLQLEQETSKKQKIDIEDASITKGKYEVVKEEEAKVLVKKQEKEGSKRQERE
ncbi:hypothetical protein Tco_0143696 [Tanacetum coccineum]